MAASGTGTPARPGPSHGPAATMETTTLGHGQRQLRASLAGSQLLGLAVMRYQLSGAR